jgi:hypothetical protein
MLGLWVFVVERNEFVRFVRHQKPKSTVALMALGIFWLLFDFAAALAGGRNHPHYFLCLTPSLAVLTGATFFLLTARLNDPVFGRRLRIALFTLVITPLTLFYVDNDLREFVHLQRYGHLLSDDSRGTHELPGFKEQVSALVDYVKSVKNEGDTLFSVESKPWVFTALSMDSPIPVMDLNFRNRFVGSIKTKFGYGVLNLLEVSPATFIVDTTKEPEVLAQGDGVYLRFLQLLERRYELVNEFVFSDDHVRLYRRVDPA